MRNQFERWSRLSDAEAAEDILCCCGSRAWADGMAKGRPYVSESHLLQCAEKLWLQLSIEDWKEAFRSHPRIGVVETGSAQDQSQAWSRDEQRDARASDRNVLEALMAANDEYERQYGITFIVCATGKTADQMLKLMHSRLNRDLTMELREAAEQQRQIMSIRLNKWLMR